MDPHPNCPPNPKLNSKHHELLLNKYVLGDLLGRGTFAKVYLARSLSSDSTVAIKILHKPHLLSLSPSAVLREVSAMRRLSHPNILKLHEVMATKSNVFLVMDYAPGGDLLSRLSRRHPHHCFPEPQARRYFHQLVSALHCCHLRGITHRDVKPQNLLIDSAGNIKLSDFGLSALPEQVKDGQLHTACGTPAFTAPEVVKRKGYDGARADAWSCGVILFVMLVGSLPFDDSNIALMYRRIHKRDYEFPPWVSNSARRMVYRLLDPNPETRITIAELMGHPWLKRSLSLDSQLSTMGASGNAGKSSNVCENDYGDGFASVNAFSIISMSSGLDLSGLFDEEKSLRMVRFMSTKTAEKIFRKLDEVGVKMSYVVEREREKSRDSESWGLVLFVEVVEVAAPMVVVEMRLEDSSGGFEREKFCWEELKVELGDIVAGWYLL